MLNWRTIASHGVVISLLVLGAASPALADDGTWTGPYIGIKAGYGWGDAGKDAAASSAQRTRVFRAFGFPSELLVTDETVAGPAVAGTLSADVDGWLGGGQIGYNWQANGLLIGVEADIQWTGQDGSSAVCTSAACAPGATYANASYDLDWIGTVRGRLGVLVDPAFLIYATGGWAFGHINADYEAGIVGGQTVSFSSDASRSGWVIGGGAEWLVHRNLTLKAEYLYMDLGSVDGGGFSTASQVITPNVPKRGFTTVTDTTFDGALRGRFAEQIFRVGLNYHFDEPEERIAPLK